MLEIIISTIFVISPQDSTSIPFDITILFDPPLAGESIIVYLDEKPLSGEINSGYFFSETNNLSKGKHNLKVITEKETEELSFSVIETEEEIPFIFTGNLSIGNQNTYFSDSSYAGQNEALMGLDFSVYKDKNSLRASLYHDPEYQTDWYPYLSYLREKTYLEAGYISPYLNELTIYSPGGFGLSGEISAGKFSFFPIILYSDNYDTLFAEYPRWLLGGKTTFKKDPFLVGFTAFYGVDDTSNITDFIIADPQRSLVLSGESELQINPVFSVGTKAAFSKGNPNLYEDSTLTGKAFEGKIIYESNLNNIEVGIRTVDEGYLTLGNSYLYTGKISAFANGAYEIESFSTYFDYLAYEENDTWGISLNQSFKWYIHDYFSPLGEYEWAKYPEFYDEKYRYLGLGFESILGPFHMENTAGHEKTTYIEETSSFRILSNFSLYLEKHILTFGVYIYTYNENASFDLTVDAIISFGSFGNININYYPCLSNGYREHLLRITYEYDF
jgi:hypothetical protein